MVLERAAVALALHRMIERDRVGLHQQAQSGLIDDVLRGRITDEREAAARAHALGLRKAARYMPVMVRVDAARRQRIPLRRNGATSICWTRSPTWSTPPGTPGCSPSAATARSRGAGARVGTGRRGAGAGRRSVQRVRTEIAA